MADYEINWLPIETAPRNGVPIVIGYSGSDSACALMGVGYWCDENELWLVDGREYGESKGNWGWCPLPPFPPEEGTQAGEVWRAQVSARRNEGHAAAKAVVEKDEAEFEEIMKAIELGTKWNKNKGMTETKE